MAKNMVIAGEYTGKGISVLGGQPQILISSNWTENVFLDKYSIESYEVITEEIRKSAASGVARGIVGGALLGPVGMLAGGLSAKNKNEVTVAILFKNGTKSLIEVDGNIYKAIVKSMFSSEPVSNVDTPVVDTPVNNSKVKYVPQQRRKGNPILKIFGFLLIIGVIGTFISTMMSNSVGNPYAKIDRTQMEEEHLNSISEYMDNYLSETEHFVVTASTKWIGFNNFSDVYTEEEFEELALGGYYSYSAQLADGRLVEARLNTYWDSEQAPEILNVSILTADTKEELVPYDEQKITDCWNEYKNRVDNVSNSDT